MLRRWAAIGRIPGSLSFVAGLVEGVQPALGVVPRAVRGRPPRPVQEVSGLLRIFPGQYGEGGLGQQAFASYKGGCVVVHFYELSDCQVKQPALPKRRTGFAKGCPRACLSGCCELAGG